MAFRSLLRLALRVCGAALCLASLAVHPAYACYCVEYCQSMKSTVNPPAGAEGQAPQPNSYVVVITWNPYPQAPGDCQYTVQGDAGGSGGSIPPSACTVQLNASGEAYQAQCVVNGGSPTNGSGTASGSVPETGSGSVGAPAGGTGSGGAGAMLTQPATTSEQPLGTTYTFHVTGGSTSTPSADSSCTTSLFLPASLGAPASASATRGGSDEVTIQWAAPQPRIQASSGSLAQLAGFQIYRHTGSDPTGTLIAQVGAAETQYVDRGLSPSQSYKYEVYASDQYGIGSAATVNVPASSTAGGCSSAGAGAPFALALVAAGWLVRRRRSLS